MAYIWMTISSSYYKIHKIEKFIIISCPLNKVDAVTNWLEGERGSDVKALEVNVDQTQL